MRLGTNPSFRRQPPLGALASAVERGVQLRRRRLAVTGGASTAVAASVVVAFAVFAGGGTSDTVLQQPARTGPEANPSVAASRGPLAAPPSQAGAALGTQGAVTTGSETQPTAASAPKATPRPTKGASSTDRRPWHKSVQRSYSGTQAGSVCQYPASSGDPYNHGWCVNEYNRGDVSGTNVATVGVELCRQTAGITGSGTLTFPTSQELEVVISRAGKTLWTWSATQRLAKQSHAFTIEQAQCYRWTTTWNGTTSDGILLGAGEYTVTATVVAPDQGNLTGTSTTKILR